ncbi:hypothetical protein B566_EDAN018121 [Ephemera danica]|nr:hypothetical protein B566_EDAN018121 [Ephemera danica]
MMQCSFAVHVALLLSVLVTVLAAPQQFKDDAEITDRRYNNYYDDDYYSDGAATTPNPDCDCVCGVTNQKLRIVGGNVTKPNEFPWVVALQRRNKFYCGATLISKRHLITAAHCMQGFNIKEITAYLGVHSRSRLQNAVSAGIKSVKIYPKFDIFSFNNDIAIIELDRHLADYSGQNAVVSGWGRIGERNITSIELRKVSVPVMSLSDCRKTDYGASRITENMICAGYKEGKRDGCQGWCPGVAAVPDLTFLACTLAWPTTSSGSTSSSETNVSALVRKQA